MPIRLSDGDVPRFGFCCVRDLRQLDNRFFVSFGPRAKLRRRAPWDSRWCSSREGGCPSEEYEDGLWNKADRRLPPQRPSRPNWIAPLRISKGLERRILFWLRFLLQINHLERNPLNNKKREAGKAGAAAATGAAAGYGTVAAAGWTAAGMTGGGAGIGTADGPAGIVIGAVVGLAVYGVWRVFRS